MDDLNPFATLPQVTFWLQNGDFSESLTELYMPEVALALVQEFKIEVDRLRSVDEAMKSLRRDLFEARKLVKLYEREATK